MLGGYVPPDRHLHSLLSHTRMSVDLQKSDPALTIYKRVVRIVQPEAIGHIEGLTVDRPWPSQHPQKPVSWILRHRAEEVGACWRAQAETAPPIHPSIWTSLSVAKDGL